MLKKSSDRTEKLISRILDTVSGIWGRKKQVATIFYAFSYSPELEEHNKGSLSFCLGLCLTSLSSRVISIEHAATCIRKQNMLQFVCSSRFVLVFCLFVCLFWSDLIWSVWNTPSYHSSFRSSAPTVREYDVGETDYRCNGLHGLSNSTAVFQRGKLTVRGALWKTEQISIGKCMVVGQDISSP